MENLKPITVDELKEIQLQILKTVAEFCDGHDIAYWLDFGTLLGAVRHGGYIPWDDDIDIGMLREDYDKFMRLFNAENERYKFKSFETDKNFYYPFGKVLDTETVLYEPDKNGLKLSVNIDVFPYDEVPPQKNAAFNRAIKKRKKLMRLEVARRHTGRARGNIARRFAVSLLKFYVRLFPRDKYVKSIIKNARQFGGRGYTCVSDLTGTETNINCVKEKFLNRIAVKFEDGEFKIPAAYDEILKMTYGDYMCFPPENERVSHHKFEAYRMNYETFDNV